MSKIKATSWVAGNKCCRSQIQYRKVAEKKRGLKMENRRRFGVFINGGFRLFSKMLGRATSQVPRIGKSQDLKKGEPSRRPKKRETKSTLPENYYHF